jgi:flagellar biosynthesis protein FlhB
VAQAHEKESRTEQASEKKLSDAREEGNVPVSREAANFTYLLAGLFVFTILANRVCMSLAGALSRFLEHAGSIRFDNIGDATQILGAPLSEAVFSAGPVLCAFLVAGVAASVFQNPPVAVFKRIAPQYSRISPSHGFKRLFGASGLLEFAKTILKFISILFAAFMAIVMIWAEFQDSLFSDPNLILSFARECAVIILMVLGIVSFALLLVDAPFAQILWRRELKMAPQELKDEHKQSEGDPLIKSRRRSLAKDRARKRMLAGVPRATIVVTNPTHFAVALRYVRAEGGAPRVVAKGQDLIALNIRRIAEEHRIPIIEDKALARSLYAKVDVDQMIPVELYRAVAEILLRLQARKKLTTHKT